MTAEELYEFFFGTFGSCGRGEPDAVAALLRDVLSRVNSGKWRGDLVDLLPTDGIMFSYLGWLNHIGLLEHGSAMPGWLTEEGRAVLVALQTHGAEVERWRA